MAQIHEFKSNLERRVSKILEKYNLDYATQYKIYYDEGRYKTYDFQLVGSNILIEVQGDYFHANPSVYKNKNSIQRKNVHSDSFKKRLAHERNYLLVELWQRDIQKNSEYVEAIISQLGELREPEPIVNSSIPPA